MQVAVILAGVPFLFDFGIKEMRFGNGDGSHFFAETEEIRFIHIGGVIPEAYSETGSLELVLNSSGDNPKIFEVVFIFFIKEVK